MTGKKKVLKSVDHYPVIPTEKMMIYRRPSVTIRLLERVASIGMRHHYINLG